MLNSVAPQVHTLHRTQSYTLCQHMYYEITVEPPNKGHFGDNINSAVLSIVGSKCIKTYRETIFWDLACVFCI